MKFKQLLKLIGDTCAKVLKFLGCEFVDVLLRYTDHCKFEIKYKGFSFSSEPKYCFQ